MASSAAPLSGMKRRQRRRATCSCANCPSGYRGENYGRYYVGELPDFLEARNAMKVTSWNMQHKQAIWRFPLDLDVDLVLLQKAGEPSSNVAN